MGPFDGTLSFRDILAWPEEPSRIPLRLAQGDKELIDKDRGDKGEEEHERRPREDRPRSEEIPKDQMQYLATKSETREARSAQQSESRINRDVCMHLESRDGQMEKDRGRASQEVGRPTRVGRKENGFETRRGKRIALVSHSSNAEAVYVWSEI